MRFGDPSLVFGNEVADGGDYTDLVGAGDDKTVGSFHWTGDCFSEVGVMGAPARTMIEAAMIKRIPPDPLYPGSA